MEDKLLNAHEALQILKEKHNIHFAVEIIYKIINESVILYPIIFIDKNQAYSIYYMRSETSKKKNSIFIEGYENLLTTLKNVDSAEINIVNIVTENCGYYVFFNKNYELLSILKSYVQNFKETIILENKYKKLGIVTSARIYNKTYLAKEY